MLCYVVLYGTGFGSRVRAQQIRTVSDESASEQAQLILVLFVSAANPLSTYLVYECCIADFECGYMASIYNGDANRTATTELLPLFGR